MQVLTFISIVSSIDLPAIISASPTPQVSDYEIIPATWNTSNNGNAFSGTVQDLSTHLAAGHGRSINNFPSPSPPYPLHRRDDTAIIKEIYWQSPICGAHDEIHNGVWKGVSTSATQDNINALGDKGLGQVGVGRPGPGICSQIACNHDAAIYWCNDYPHRIKAENTKQLVEGARMVMDTCKYMDGKTEKTVGQVFAMNGQLHNIVIHSQNKCLFHNALGSTMPNAGSAGK